MSHTCLVCAYPKLKSPPRSPSGGGSYEICPACGYQYGVDDDDRGITPAEWRQRWVAGGAVWSSASIKPPAGWKFNPAPVKKTGNKPSRTPGPKKSDGTKNTISLKRKPAAAQRAGKSPGKKGKPKHKRAS